MSTQDQTEDFTTQLSHYLSGMQRVSDTAMQDIIDFEDWQRLAAEELRRRMANKTLACVPDDILAAIAIGKVSMHRVAEAVLQSA